MKNYIFFSNLKKFTSPAKEFLIHKFRNMHGFFFSNLKVQLMSFCCKNVETKKWKYLIFFSNLKKCISPAMCFCYIYTCRNNRKIKISHVSKYCAYFGTNNSIWQLLEGRGRREGGLHVVLYVRHAVVPKESSRSWRNSLSRLILQTKFRLVLNLSEKCNHNWNFVWIE